jgi:hypothetical protein
MGIRQETKQGNKQRWATATLVHTSAILRTTGSIAELRTKKSCGTAIADLQNWTSEIPQLSVTEIFVINLV